MNLREMEIVPIIGIFRTGLPGNFLNLDPRAGRLGTHLSSVRDFDYAGVVRQDINVVQCPLKYSEILDEVPLNVETVEQAN